MPRVKLISSHFGLIQPFCQLLPSSTVVPLRVISVIVLLHLTGAKLTETDEVER